MEQIIQDFMKSKKIALAGASRTPGKWGNELLTQFQEKGFSVELIHPQAESIQQISCVPSVSDLSNDVENLLVVLPKDRALDVVKQCKGTAIKRIWLQKGAGGGSFSSEAKSFCHEEGIELIYGLCPMMYLDPQSIHKFHFSMKKFFRTLPKEFKPL